MSDLLSNFMPHDAVAIGHACKNKFGSLFNQSIMSIDT